MHIYYTCLDTRSSWCKYFAPKKVGTWWLVSPFLFAQIAKSYWKAWHEFEVHHGNVDTFREMLRIKRSVQAQFNTQVNFMSAQMLAAASGLSADTTHSGQSPTLPTCITHTRNMCRWLYPLQYSPFICGTLFL